MGLFDGMFGGVQTPDSDVTPVSDPNAGGYDTLGLIKRFEGYAPRASWDYAQYSNGYGTKAAYPGEVIDQTTANQRLSNEAGKVDSWIDQNVKTPLTPQQRGALVSFGYNTGTGSLGNILPDINSGNFDRAAQRMLSYNKAGGSVLPGLVDRRRDEANLFLGKDVPSMADASNASAPGVSIPGVGDASGVLVPPQDRLKELAAAFTNQGVSMPVHGYGDMIRGLAGILLGNKYGGEYQQQVQDYQKKRGDLIAGAAGNPIEAQRVAARIPETQAAALTQMMSPKDTWTPVEINDPYAPGGKRTAFRHPMTGVVKDADGNTVFDPSSAQGSAPIPAAQPPQMAAAPSPGEPAAATPPATPPATPQPNAPLPPTPAGQPPAKISIGAALKNGIAGDQMLKVIADNYGAATAARVKAIHDGDEVPGNAGDKDKSADALKPLVYAYDKNWNESLAQTRANFRKSFTDPNHTNQKQALSLNNALNHSDQFMTDYLEKMPDHSTQLQNSVSGMLGDQFNNKDYEGATRLSSFLGPEMVRVATGAEGGEAERLASAKGFQPASGRAKIEANLAAAGGVLDDKLRAFTTQWRSVMGDKPIPPEILTPNGKDIVDRLRKLKGDGTNGPTAAYNPRSGAGGSVWGANPSTPTPAQAPAPQHAPSDIEAEMRRRGLLK
jgi:lysozyme